MVSGVIRNCLSPGDNVAMQSSEGESPEAMQTDLVHLVVDHPLLCSHGLVGMTRLG